MALMNTEFSKDRLSLIDDNGNLLVLTVRERNGFYTLSICGTSVMYVMGAGELH